jgi:hypothetical protein
MSRFLQLFLCAALSNVLVGCGDDHQQPKNTVDKAQAKPEEAKPKEVEEEETKSFTPQAPVASGSSKLSQTGTKQTESDSPKSNNLLLVITIISLITAAIAISITFYLYRWRKLIQANPSSMVPEEWGGVLREHSSVIQQITDAINQSSKVTDLNTETFSSNIQQNSEKLEQMISTYLTLQKSLDEKDQEIARLKKGYDNKIFKSFVRRFIRVDQIIKETLDSKELSKKEIENIAAFMIDALEESNVESFGPQIGKNYRELGDLVADKPTIIETNDPSLDFTIAEIESPGYQLSSEEESQILVPARVAIYRLEQIKQEEEQS